MKLRIPLLACIATLILASTSLTHGQANFSGTTVGVMNTNSLTLTGTTTGDSFDAPTFAANMTTAFANDTGGVWNMETSFTLASGNTATLSYGTSQTKTEVFTLSTLAGDTFQTSSGVNATSGSLGLVEGGNSDNRTFTLSTPLLSVGIFTLNRGDGGRTASLTATFQDNSTATATGALGNGTYFYGLSGTTSNLITSITISNPQGLMRYDDLGFIVAPATAVPEPTSTALVLGGIGMLALLRLRQRRNNILG